MSAAAAPTARADDFTDVIKAIEGDYTAGQTDFGTAETDFSGGDVNDGLAALFSGLDDDFVSPSANLYVGSVDLLANDTVTGPLTASLSPEPDFSTGLTDAEGYLADAQEYFGLAATDLSSGDYADAAYLDSVGSLIDVAASQVLVEGAVASF